MFFGGFTMKTLLYFILSLFIFSLNSAYSLELPPDNISKSETNSVQPILDNLNEDVEEVKEVNKVVDGEKTIKAVKNKLKKLEEKYGIEFYIGANTFEPSSYAKQWNKWVDLTDDDYEELNRYMNVFIEEWNKYPVNWVKNSNLKGIAIVKKLNVSNQYRAAMPDAYGEVLYYDIEYGYAGEIYEREVIHHEYYHMIEDNYFGSFYYKDPKWNAFNEKGFKYGNGGASAYEEENFSNKDHPKKGFASTYSMYGLEEDKAEVYAYLFTTHYYSKMMKWVKEDEILNKKVNYMLDFLKSKDSELTKEYLDKIHKEK